jgi:glycosyltransferase involved in cell wall biosynthesis
MWVGKIQNSGLIQRAAKLGLTNVDSTGEVSDPVSEYARFDVLLMSSWEDPCPLVVFEAMALGKPVVCFANSGGAQEQLGEAGVVIEDFSPDKAAEALLRLAEEPARRAQIGRALKERVRSFTGERQIPKIIEEIRSLLPAARRG